MDLSLFLAKLLGLYLLIVAVDMLLRKHELEGAVRDFSSTKSLLVFSGSTSLFLGLVIVLAHPVYEVDWDGLVTLLGYLLIVRGIARVCFPAYLQKKIVTYFHQGYWVILLVLLVLGIYLTYQGFTAG